MKIFPGNERGRVDMGWLKSWHTFSFGDYYNAEMMNFNRLRVMNDDWVAGGTGFPMHPHRNMEIITYVMTGALMHSDSLGNGAPIKPGELQVMHAGSGIHHSEANASDTEATTLLQIWLIPDEQNVTPGYEQETLPLDAMKNSLALVAGPKDSDAQFKLYTDAKLYITHLDGGHSVQAGGSASRDVFVQIATGSATINGEKLEGGDAAGFVAGEDISIEASADSQILVFDMAK